MGKGILPGSVGKKRGSVDQETTRDAAAKRIKHVNVCGQRPTSQSAVGSFVCLVSFGVSVRGCLDPLRGADGGGAHVQSRPAVTQGPAPAESFGTLAQDTICNANSPRLQHPTRRGSASTGTSPARP